MKPWSEKYLGPCASNERLRRYEGLKLLLTSAKACQSTNKFLEVHLFQNGWVDPALGNWHNFGLGWSLVIYARDDDARDEFFTPVFKALKL